MNVERIEASRGTQSRFAARASAASAAALVALAALPASAATLDRIRDTGSIRFGYLVDARPLTFRNEAGAADGYAVELCKQVADSVKAQLGMSSLRVEWVPVAYEDRLGGVQQGGIDLLCTPMSVTLARRQEVSFSIPVFAGGNRAVLRADAPTVLLDALAESRSTRAVWRGSPAAKVLKGTTVGVVAGTTSEKWLEGRRQALQVDATIVPVADYRSGVRQVLDGKVDVFFGDRAIVLGAIAGPERKDLVILDRQFTHELLAFALARGDEDFRLAVDRALSELYASGEFGDLYKRWHGEFGENTRVFFLHLTSSE
jgi:polar amino acid transport system substrate-binding protein